jgi:hypothetical protein
MAKKRSRSKLDKELDKLDADIQRYKTGIGMPGRAVPTPKPKTPKVISATRLERAVEEEVKSLRKPFWEGKDLGSLSFYFISFLICVAVLAFLFGSVPSFVFYLAFGIFLWWWSHTFHTTQAGTLKSFFSLGFVVVLLYVSYWFFDDLFSILVFIIYALSFLISGVLYFYHVQRNLAGEIHRSFPRTFLVMFYSHIMAFTAASAVAYLLPELLLSDSFISIPFLLFAWLLPVLLVYFFLTKFLYLRFFDRVHIKRDLSKGLVHGAIYAILFILVLLFAYVLTAMQFVVEERAGYDDTFSTVFTTLHNVKSDIKAVPFQYDTTELLEFKVTKDVIALSEQSTKEATELKDRLGKTSVASGDYLSDNYFTMLSHDRLAVSSMAVLASEVDELNDDLLREYRRMKRFQAEGVFDDGTKSLEEHGSVVKRYAKDAYTPYSEPYQLTMLRTRISRYLNSYSGLVEDGELLEFNIAYLPEASILKPGESRFSKRFYEIAHHTVLFRDLMLFMFNTMAFHVEETLDPYAVSSLYYAAAEESLPSSVLRYRVIKSNIDALFSIAE